MARRTRVLNINYDSNEYSGVVIFLMNVFQYIDHQKFQLDFLTPGTTAYNLYKTEIESVGGNIFEFHINCDSTKGKISFGRRLRQFLKSHPYDIIHINSGSVPFDCVAAIISKSAGAKVIVHSHNAAIRSWWKNPITFLLKSLMQINADVLCACSEKAAFYTFTSRKVKQGDVILIKNGIDLNKFQYNVTIRNEIREELGVEECFVVGHVGRFSSQKNHTFLIDIFAEVLKKEPTAMLLLIGQGELEPDIREKVNSLNINEHVIFMGSRSNVEDFYQAMDVLLLPSLYEGLPLTLIEAQMNGLPCCISNAITEQVDLTNLIHRESLQNSPEDWAKMILSCAQDPTKRCSRGKELKNAGYDIRMTASHITKIYENLMN